MQNNDKVINKIHQTNLLEAIKLLGRAASLAKPKNHFWQAGRLTKAEIDLIQQKIELLHQLHQQYDAWFDQFEKAFQQKKVEQYDDLHELLLSMVESCRLITDASSFKLSSKRIHKQLMKWVKEELELFRQEIESQHAWLTQQDQQEKERELQLIREILLHGRDDLDKMIWRLASCQQHLLSYHQHHEQKKPSIAWLNRYRTPWSAEHVLALEDAVQDLKELSISYEDTGQGLMQRAVFRYVSTFVPVYSSAAKTVFCLHLDLLAQQQRGCCDAFDNSLVDDLIEETRVVFDTLKSMRANLLQLLLYKIDHHKSRLSDDDQSNIQRMLQGEDFDILRYSKAQNKQPRHIKASSLPYNESREVSSVPRALSRM
jgi:hypothetical protein